MKHNILIAIAIGFVGLLFASCEQKDPFKNTVYGPTYSYNYYLVNDLNENVVFYYLEEWMNPELNSNSCSFTMTPGGKALIYRNAIRPGVEMNSGKPMPILTIEDGTDHIIYDGYNQSEDDHHFMPTFKIGNDAPISFDPDQHMEIFLTENYRAEIINDTTFHFYFTIDNEYIASLNK